MAELQYNLNRLAGTTGLDAQRAANIWAGTSGKDLVGAVNAKAGLPTATYSSTGNVLSLNQSSFEVDTAGWTVGASYFSNGTGMTLTRDTSVYFAGSASGKVIADGFTIYQGPYIQLALTASTTYTVVARVKTSGTGPGVSLNVRDSTGLANYQTTTVSSSAWTEHRLTFTTTAAATTAFISVTARAAGGGQAETFWIDCIGVWQGSGGDWAPGGYPITLSATGTKDLDGALNAIAGTSGLGVNGASDACIGNKTNLIPANGASFETDASYWDINASLTKAVTNTTCAAGTQSLLVTMNVNGGDLGIKGFTPGSNIACTAGNTYTVVASFLKGLGSRQNYYIYGEWRNAGNTTISTFQSTKVTANTWTEARVTATAPALTTSVQLWFIVFDTGVATDTFYVDKIGMWQDNPTAQWTL